MVKGRARLIMLVLAALLVIGAIWLSFSIGSGSELERLCELVNKYGYDVRYDDIYPASSADNASLFELTGVTRGDEAYEASVANGFPADIDTAGDVAVLLAPADEGRVITLMVLNGEVQLAFIQVLSTGEMLPL